MAGLRPTSPHRSLATPLSLAYAALVLYASLYPFTDWRWPPGQSLRELALLPWTRWTDSFDVGSNLVGYLPLGALICLAACRSGMRPWMGLVLGVAAPSGLSYGCEFMQHFLPGRVPAMEDWTMNSAGALAGSVLAGMAHGWGLLDRWQGLRSRWFVRDSAGGLALLALWPVGLLFPAPVPLGLGQVGERLRGALAELLDGVPWADTVHQMLAVPAAPEVALRPLAEVLIVALGLLTPCLVAYSVMAPGWRRGAMALGALATGIGAMSLSALLNFGPGHATAWLGATAGPGLGLGLMLALAMVPAPRRLAAGLALVALTGLVVGVAHAPADPYFAQSLKAWERGRFVRFHGLAQWIGWLWPYLSMLWLLAGLGSRDRADGSRRRA
jgi:VanZ family protein